jgi:hypothetical protein
MKTHLLLLPPFPFSNKTHSHHLDHFSSDETGSCVEVSSQTILNLDHSSQSPVLNSINPVANRSSNRTRRMPVTRNRDFLW